MWLAAWFGMVNSCLKKVNYGEIYNAQRTRCQRDKINSNGFEEFPGII
jgi:hypothetical protein